MRGRPGGTETQTVTLSTGGGGRSVRCIRSWPRARPRICSAIIPFVF